MTIPPQTKDQEVYQYLRERILHVVEQLRERAQELKHNHRALVAAMAVGDADAAEAKMRRHIRDAKEIVTNAWAQWQSHQQTTTQNTLS